MAGETFSNTLQDEAVLAQAKQGKLVLTTHRIRYQARRFWRRHMVAIPLEAYGGATLGAFFPMWLLVFLVPAMAFGVFFLVLAFVDDLDFLGGALPLLVVSTTVLLLVLRYVLTLHTAGGTVRIPVRHADFEKLRVFLDQAEAAKDALGDPKRRKDLSTPMVGGGPQFSAYARK